MPNADPRRLQRRRESLIRLHRLAGAGRMTASFAHQMRSPLQTIQSQAEFALEFLSPPAKIKGSLDAILANAQRLSHTIESLLSMARTGRCELKEGEVGPVMEEACRLIEPAAKKQGVRLIRRFEGDWRAPRDPYLLESAVFNLLSNALEAMPSGGNLVVGIGPIREGFQILIEDSGKGIAPEHLTQIGKPFFTTKEDGTGLGVYTARQIVELHGASLLISGNKGAGAAVAIIWPKRKQGSA